MDKPYVFVAGPIRTSGILEHNVRAAALAASELARAGFVPFVPHLNILWNFVDPLPEAHWKEWDRDWLVVCDAVFRLPGESHGADEETDFAKGMGIPVFRDIGALKDWRDQQAFDASRRQPTEDSDAPPPPAPSDAEDACVLAQRVSELFTRDWPEKGPVVEAVPGVR